MPSFSLLNKIAMYKKIILFSFFTLSIVVYSSAQSVLQTIYTEFAGTTINPDSNGHYWNNMTSANPIKLINSKDSATNFAFTYVAGAWITNTTGVGLLNPSPALLGDFAVASATSNLYYNTSSGQFRISGLNAKKGYKFYLFGSRMTGNPARITRYTLSGIDSFVGMLQTSGTNLGGPGINQNNSTIVASSILTPDTSGVINLTVAVDSGGFAYLNTMKMEEYDNSLPVTIANLSVSQISNGVKLYWHSLNETDIESYVVEKSVDGVTFEAAGTVAALNNGENAYSFTDEDAVKATNYYRLKVREKNGVYKFSNTIRLSQNVQRSKILVYPNPVIGLLLSLQVSNVEKGTYNVLLLSNDGRIIQSQSLEHSGGNSVYSLPINSCVAKGNYHLVLMIGNKTVTSQKIIIE